MMTYDELIEYNKNREFLQIGYVTRDVERCAREWTERLKIGPWRFVTLSNETCRDAKVLKGGKLEDLGEFKFRCALCDAGNMQFELMQPIYGNTIYGKYLEEHGEGLHHFKEKIKFEDWESVVKMYAEDGTAVIMCGAFGNSGWAYLDTEEACIFELGDMRANETLPEGCELSYYPPRD